MLNNLLLLRRLSVHQNRRVLLTEIKKCFSSEEAVIKKLPETKNEKNKSFSELSDYRFIYPEFLPDPNFEFRHKIREKLERQDMLKRRCVINIPEFYVGSVLAVTASDQYSPGKTNRFVGICISRTYAGLRASFVLRNVVDHQGIEILYDLYNPALLSIEVLKLEKRLDEELYYLRDAPAHYSTFPFDMEPEFIVEGAPVRINQLVVKLKPPPWYRKWEQTNFKGVDVPRELLKSRKILKARRAAEPWEAYDIMKEYRRCIPEEDQEEIWRHVDAHKENFPVRRQAWKKTLQKAVRKKKTPLG